MMKNRSNMPVVICLLLFVSMALGCAAQTVSNTVAAVYNFAAVNSTIVNSRRLTITPIPPPYGYQWPGAALAHSPLPNAFIIPTPLQFSPTLYPQMTNGTLTVSNLWVGYPYLVTISDFNGPTSFTNYFQTNLTGVVDASTNQAVVYGTNLIANVNTNGWHWITLILSGSNVTFVSTSNGVDTNAVNALAAIQGNAAILTNTFIVLPGTNIGFGTNGSNLTISLKGVIPTNFLPLANAGFSQYGIISVAGGNGLDFDYNNSLVVNYDGSTISIDGNTLQLTARPVLNAVSNGFAAKTNAVLYGATNGDTGLAFGSGGSGIALLGGHGSNTVLNAPVTTNLAEEVALTAPQVNLSGSGPMLIASANGIIESNSAGVPNTNANSLVVNGDLTANNFYGALSYSQLGGFMAWNMGAASYPYVTQTGSGQPSLTDDGKSWTNIPPAGIASPPWQTGSALLSNLVTGAAFTATVDGLGTNVLITSTNVYGPNSTNSFHWVTNLSANALIASNYANTNLAAGALGTNNLFYGASNGATGLPLIDSGAITGFLAAQSGQGSNNVFNGPTSSNGLSVPSSSSGYVISTFYGPGLAAYLDYTNALIGIADRVHLAGTGQHSRSFSWDGVILWQDVYTSNAFKLVDKNSATSFTITNGTGNAGFFGSVTAASFLGDGSGLGGVIASQGGQGSNNAFYQPTTTNATLSGKASLGNIAATFYSPGTSAVINYTNGTLGILENYFLNGGHNLEQYFYSDGIQTWALTSSSNAITWQDYVTGVNVLSLTNGGLNGAGFGGPLNVPGALTVQGGITGSGAGITGLTPGQAGAQPTNANLTGWGNHATNDYASIIALAGQSNWVGVLSTNGSNYVASYSGTLSTNGSNYVVSYAQPTNYQVTLLSTNNAVNQTNYQSTNLVNNAGKYTNNFTVSLNTNTYWLYGTNQQVTISLTPPLGSYFTFIVKSYTANAVITNNGTIFTVPGTGTVTNGVQLGAWNSPSNMWTGVYDGANW